MPGFGEIDISQALKDVAKKMDEWSDKLLGIKKRDKPKETAVKAHVGFEGITDAWKRMQVNISGQDSPEMEEIRRQTDEARRHSTLLEAISGSMRSVDSKLPAVT